MINTAKQIEVQGTVIILSLAKNSDYFCNTDMANAKDKVAIMQMKSLLANELFKQMSE